MILGKFMTGPRFALGLPDLLHMLTKEWRKISIQAANLITIIWKTHDIQTSGYGYLTFSL